MRRRIKKKILGKAVKNVISFFGSLRKKIVNNNI